MTTKPKPPRRVVWCADCGSFNGHFYDSCLGGVDSVCLVTLDVVPDGGARVVRMAKRWILASRSKYAESDRKLCDAIYAMDAARYRALDAMKRKGRRR